MSTGSTLYTRKANASYREWQARLVAAFVDGPTGPFNLFLDDEQARMLWPADTDPVGGLGAAVSGELDQASRGDVFGRISTHAERWRRGDRSQCPPTLPVLAATVVAATRMQRDVAAAETAFFVRLAQTLDPSRTGGRLEDFRTQLSQSYEPVPEMWEQLETWLGERFNSAGSTIRSHPRLRRIGYSLSQAMLNRADRLRLTEFFRAAGIGAEPVPEPRQLLRQLQIWAARSRGLSQSLEQALQDASAAPLLAEQVAEMALKWDGVVRTATGRARLGLRIALDLDPLAAGARWVVPVAEGVEIAIVTLSTGGAVALQQPEGGRLYRVRGTLPPVAEGLARDLSGRGETCDLVGPRGDVLVFAEDEAAGGWLSVPSVRPFDEHVLAARPAVKDATEAALAAADEGWQLERQRADRPLLPGWYLYAGVRFSNASSFAQAAARLPPSIARALRPDSSPRPRLTAGLPIGRRLGRDIYLAGGEPDIEVPAGAGPKREVDASLDGRAQQPPFQATGFPIELRRIGRWLELGEHCLEVDGMRLAFRTMAGSPAPVRRGRIAWSTSDTGDASLGPVAPGEGDVCGARVAGGAAAGILVRRYSRCWLVDRRGGVTVVRAPEPGSWIGERGLADPLYFELTPPADAVWLVTQSGRAKPAARLVRWAEPAVRALTELDREQWQVLAGAESDKPETWQLYVAAARRAGA